MNTQEFVCVFVCVQVLRVHNLGGRVAVKGLHKVTPGMHGTQSNLGGVCVCVMTNG